MKKWIHAPLHLFNDKGTYMVTSSTLHKEHFFKEDNDFEILQNLLFELSDKYGWKLEAWALFSNHYHFIVHSSNDPITLKNMIAHLHSSSARQLNKAHQTVGRTVWYQYWDTHISYQASYLARLNYVMQNPVKHKLVACASQYPWCSAGWFEKAASAAHYKTVMSMKTDSLSVYDDF